MILFILESHRPLHLGASVDEGAERIDGQRLIVSSGVDVLELPGVAVVFFGVQPANRKPSISLAAFSVYPFSLYWWVGVVLQHAAKIALNGRAVLVEDNSEDQHLAVAEIHRTGPSRKPTNRCRAADRSPSAR